MLRCGGGVQVPSKLRGAHPLSGQLLRVWAACVHGSWLLEGPELFEVRAQAHLYQMRLGIGTYNFSRNRLRLCGKKVILKSER